MNVDFRAPYPGSYTSSSTLDFTLFESQLCNTHLQHFIKWNSCIIIFDLFHLLWWSWFILDNTTDITSVVVGLIYIHMDLACISL